jgi:phage recombination protein Bet
MSDKVATIKAPSVPALAMSEQELITVLQSSLYPGASVASIKLVLGYCKAAGHDPLQKPCHIVPMWDSKAGQMRDVIMPGVGLYRTQAARTGQFAGMTEPEFGPDVTETIGGLAITYPKWCRVTVKRQLETGLIAEFTARELWIENYAVKGGKEKSVAPNSMWARRTYGQLAKCASAQALRLAFPEATGAGVTADEMEGKPLDEGLTIDGDSKREADAPKRDTSPKPYAEEQFQKNLPAWTALIRAGKKDAAQIIAMVSSKAALSDEQKALILAIKPEPAKSNGENGAPAASFAVVADKLNHAEDAELLALAADLIRMVADEGQQGELTAIYKKRKAELEASTK